MSARTTGRYKVSSYIPVAERRDRHAAEMRLANAASIERRERVRKAWRTRRAKEPR